MMMHRSSKRAKFHRILNDMLAFDDQQLLILIQLARKVYRSKVMLKSAADQAEQLVGSLKSGGQSEMFTAQAIAAPVPEQIVDDKPLS